MLSLTNSMERWALGVVLLMGTIVATTGSGVNAQSPQQALTGDWPSFLGPQRDGRSTERGLDLAEVSQGLPLSWELACGTGYASCSVEGNRCLIFDGEPGFARLRCVDAANGKLLWTYRYPSAYEDMYGFDSGPRCAPVISDGMVFVYGVEGELHAVDLQHGTRIWSVDVMDQFGCVQNFFGVGSTPLVYDDLLLVMVGGSPPDSQAVPPGQLDQVDANGSAVVAFDKRTGEVRYQIGDDLASYGSIVTCTIDDQAWGFAFARAGLLAFDPTRGDVRFHFPWRAKKLESVNASTPVVVGNQVFITESYRPGGCVLEVTDAAPPQVVWKDEGSRDQSMACHWCTPVFHEGYLYGCHGQHAGTAELRCVRWEDGKVMWSHPGLGRCSVTFVDGQLICLGERGELLLVEATPERFVQSATLAFKLPSGEVVPSTDRLTYPAWAAPVVAGGQVYLRGKGQFIAARLLSGQED
ncbi:MAG: PQQ-binding-like beta-propeller repeat protein [Planctomycetota bacterium]